MSAHLYKQIYSSWRKQSTPAGCASTGALSTSPSPMDDQTLFPHDGNSTAASERRLSSSSAHGVSVSVGGSIGGGFSGSIGTR